MHIIPAVSDPPCDFSAFVAERRAITREEAEAQVASWLAGYEPRIRRAAIARPWLDSSTPMSELRSCA